nr:hypothetical protein [Tanacetum cinerariifolium]
MRWWSWCGVAAGCGVDADCGVPAVVLPESAARKHGRKIRENKMEARVKENQEKDEIGSKPDKNGRRGEAEKSQKQLQLKEEEKPKKTKKNGRKRTHGLKVIKLLIKEEMKRANI